MFVWTQKHNNGTFLYPKVHIYHRSTTTCSNGPSWEHVYLLNHHEGVVSVVCSTFTTSQPLELYLCFTFVSYFGHICTIRHRGLVVFLIPLKSIVDVLDFRQSTRKERAHQAPQQHTPLIFSQLSIFAGGKPVRVYAHIQIACNVCIDSDPGATALNLCVSSAISMCAGRGSAWLCCLVEQVVLYIILKYIEENLHLNPPLGIPFKLVLKV